MAGLSILAICPVQNAFYYFFIVLAPLFIICIRTALSEGHHHCWHIILQYSHMMQLNILYAQTTQGLFSVTFQGEWYRPGTEHKCIRMRLSRLNLDVLLHVFMCLPLRSHAQCSCCMYTPNCTVCFYMFSCFSHMLPCTNLKCLRLA